MTDEEIKVLTDVEHVKKRKAIYMGEVSDVEQDTFVYDDTELSFRTVKYNTGLLKLFDEIFTNAIDNYQRTKGAARGKTTEVYVELASDHISVKNNGKSIPIELMEVGDKKLYKPQVVFTVLRSGTNFDDTTSRTWGGTNGVGSKIVSILSHKFEIDIVCDKKHYTQLVEDSTHTIHPPIIRSCRESDYTKVSFYPMFEEFGKKGFADDDTLSMCRTRVYDVAYLPLALFVNGKQIAPVSWKQFAQQRAAFFTEDEVMTYEDAKSGWKYAFTASSVKSCISSYVNYINTNEGGKHVDELVDKLRQHLKNSYKSLNVNRIRDKLFMCVSAIVVNPTFESQAKNRLTSSVKATAPSIPTELLKSFAKNTSIVALLEGKEVAKKNRLNRSALIAAIPKAKDATYAGNAKYKERTRLILTEGDSALTTAVNGIEYIKNGLDYFGLFPLRGKSLNVRSSSLKSYLENQEWNHLKILLGLEDGKEYNSISKLRYGGVILMTDADTDGAHIKALIINFFECKFPSILQIDGYIREFITPMVKITMKESSLVWKQNRQALLMKAYKGSVAGTYTYPLYNRVEFAKFEEKYPTATSQSKVSYIKGLGTIEKFDAKQYFTHFEDNEIKILFDEHSHEVLDKAFSNKRADDRKEWIASITENTYLERCPRTPISCNDFIDADLCLFSFDNCVRAIPSMVDGLKPTQRKILCALFQMGNKAYENIKVTELGGLVTKEMKYEHGDTSMNETIVKLAQDYTGSNNINLLIPIGQFGTRRMNGDDHAAYRYLHTRLNKIARKLFPFEDDDVLNYKLEEGDKVEPTYYVPILPMVLINGAMGLGTGWSTEVPSFDPVELCKLIRQLVSGEIVEVNEFNLPSWYKDFRGTVVYETKSKRKSLSSKVNVCVCDASCKQKLPRWRYEGVYTFDAHDDTDDTFTIRVSDAWCENSIDKLFEVLNKMIVDGIVVSLTAEKYTEAKFVATFDATKIDEDTVVERLGLNGTIAETNMTMFNSNGVITRYNCIADIIREWYDVRYECYLRRIALLIKRIENDIVMLSNRYRFVKEIAIDETLIINRRKKDDIVKELTSKHYDKMNGSYDYLLSMSIYSLTKEKLEELAKELETKKEQLEYYKNITPEELWLDEIASLEAVLCQ